MVLCCVVFTWVINDGRALVQLLHNTQVDNTHGSIVTCCVSCFLVMTDLKGSECLSVEECAAVFQYYDGWERRLVGEAAMKESYIVEKIASVMDKHVSSSEETRELKGMEKIE